MKFANFEAIHYFWLVAVIVLFFLHAFRSRRRAMERFADASLLDDITPSLDRSRKVAKAAVIVAALAAAALALMRPQWGFEWKEVRRSGLDILIAIDTSRSMLAEDVKPNRLERSKLAVKDLIRKLQGDRIGLIAFAGDAFVQCPLTVDYSGFMLSLDDLDVHTIPKGGTSVAKAIEVALDSYEGGKKKYKVLVVITDGEDHQGKAVELAEKAKEQGIRVFTLGIGTREGELIPVSDDRGGRMFLKDRSGNVVKSSLDENLLQQIALITGGSYVKATATEFGLDLIYEQKLSKMEKREFKNKMVKKYRERYQFPLALAVLLLCTEPWIRERRRPGKELRSGRYEE